MCPRGFFWKKIVPSRLSYMVWLVTNDVMWLKEDVTHLAKI